MGTQLFGWSLLIIFWLFIDIREHDKSMKELQKRPIIDAIIRKNNEKIEEYEEIVKEKI